MVEVNADAQSETEVLNEMTAIKHCLEYLYHESQRVGLSDSADLIAEAVVAIELALGNRQLAAERSLDS